MKVGDKVRFLSEIGGGTVRGFQGKDIALVEGEDGFDNENVDPIDPEDGMNNDDDDEENGGDDIPEEPETPEEPELPEDKGEESYGFFNHPSQVHGYHSGFEAEEINVLKMIYDLVD